MRGAASTSARLSGVPIEDEIPHDEGRRPIAMDVPQDARGLSEAAGERRERQRGDEGRQTEHMQRDAEQQTHDHRSSQFASYRPGVSPWAVLYCASQRSRTAMRVSVVGGAMPRIMRKRPSAATS
jgi:hypothetical protein